MSKLIIHQEADRKLYSGQFSVTEDKLRLRGLQYSPAEKKMIWVTKTFTLPANIAIPSAKTALVLTDGNDKVIDVSVEGRWVFTPDANGNQVGVYATTAAAVDEYPSCTKVVFPVKNGDATVWHKATFWGKAAKNALMLRPENGEKKRVILTVGKPRMFAGHPEHMGLAFDLM